MNDGRPRSIRPLGPRPKLGEEVTRHLREALMIGAYSRGQRMGIEELAQGLGTSTMPIREALIALAGEGLIEALPHRGFRVALLTRNDVEDIFTVHGIIAGLLAERAAATIDESDLRRLMELQRDIQRLGRRPVGKTHVVAAQIEELNFLFHQTINHSTGAKRLQWFLRAANRFIPRGVHEWVPEWTAATVNDHPPIIAALRRRNGPTARRLMEAHIKNGAGEMIQLLERQGLWAESGDGTSG